MHGPHLMPVTPARTRWMRGSVLWHRCTRWQCAARCIARDRIVIKSIISSSTERRHNCEGGSRTGTNSLPGRRLFLRLFDRMCAIVVLEANSLGVLPTKSSEILEYRLLSSPRCWWHRGLPPTISVRPCAVPGRDAPHCPPPFLGSDVTQRARACPTSLDSCNSLQE